MFYRDVIYGGEGGASGHYPSSIKPPGMNNKIHEMLMSPIQEMRELGKVLQEQEEMKETLNINLVKEIQTIFPETIIAGSIALYLHGIQLHRIRKKSSHEHSDIDIIVPHYINFSEKFTVNNFRYNPSPLDANSDGFDYSFSIRHEFRTGTPKDTKVDVKIDPKRAYEFKTTDEFKFKVTPVEDILEAKIHYMRKNVEKHKNDLYEIIGLIDPEVRSIPVDADDKIKKSRRSAWGGS